MKIYKVFVFNDNKKNFERYSYIKEVTTDEPEKLAKNFYEDEFGLEISKEIKVQVWDTRITINKVKFASQTIAYIPNNGGKAIVLAEKIINKKCNNPITR